MTRYLGTCAETRRRGGDTNWNRMISMAEPVSETVFLRNVDLRPILDEDETPTGFIRSLRASDPDTGTFRSVWGRKRCWFLSSAGFEFIFVE